MITVVIPCYNVSTYLCNCIKALENQTFKQFQVVLVDDCSNDDTYQLMLDIQSSSKLNICVLQNPVNSGPAASRNNGIMAASTKYITFCDSDDWYEPDFLEKMVYLLEKNEADIVFCGHRVVDENGKFTSRPICGKTGLISREEAFSLDADSLCMLMIKTSIMKNTLLPNLRNGEDVATVPLLMAKAQKYIATDECLYNYFRRSDSASEKPSMKVVDSLLNSFEYVKEHFPKEYSVELEFLGIKNVLYAAIITLSSIEYDKNKVCSIVRKFEEVFPDWYKNPYISRLRNYKKLVVKLLAYRCYFLIRLLAILRNQLVK